VAAFVYLGVALTWSPDRFKLLESMTISLTKVFSIMRFTSLLWLAAVFLGFAPGALYGANSDDDKADSPVFYPPAPNQPRLQFLKKFSSVQDLAGESGGFRNFVFGDERFEEQSLEKPFGVDIYKGSIYVVDSRGLGYVVFDVVKGKQRNVTGSGSGVMPKPINIKIDKNGHRFITDTKRNMVLEFDTNDRFVRSYGEDGQFRPIDVAITDTRLYVSDSENNKIHVLDRVSGESLFDFGGGGSGPGKFVHPTSLAIGPDGSIYVTDTTNFRIQQFSADGEFIRSIGSVGTSFGKFARPKGIDVDKEGRIYVVDAAFQNVQIFDDEGRVLMFFGGSGEGRGDMNLPTVVSIDYDNVEHFREYAAPGFEIEYLVIVANQFGSNKVAVYGFGTEVD
jgi:DNA-binding beta-propeller fold protein YncE